MDEELQALSQLALGIKELGTITKKRGGRGDKIPKEQREQFKNTIRDHRLYGISWKTTCKHLFIAKNTYYALVNEIAKDALNDEIKNKDALLQAYYDGKNEDIMEASAAYQKTKQLGFLVARTQMRDSLFLRLQSAGFIPKVTENIVVADNAEVVKNPVDAIMERLEKVVDARRATRESGDSGGAEEAAQRNSLKF